MTEPVPVFIARDRNRTCTVLLSAYFNGRSGAFGPFELRLASPTKFTMQRRVVAMVWQASQLKTDCRFSHFDSIALSQWLFNLSVDDERRTGWKLR